MSAADEITVLLSGIDRQIAPRTEFADALRARLLEELRPAVSASAAPRGAPRLSWRGSITSLAHPRWRVVVVALVLLLLLASVATATYLSHGEWFSSSPRGAQVTTGYRLSVIAKMPWTDGELVTAAALSSDGHDLYLVHNLLDHQRRAEVIRIRDVDTPTPSRPVLAIDTSKLPTSVRQRNEAVIAPGVDGSLYVFVASSSTTDAELVAVRPDGTRQLVARRADFGLPEGVADPEDSADSRFGIAAVSESTLWVRIKVLHRTYSANWPYDWSWAFFEVTDPTADGDWSDRVIRRVLLPGDVPAGRTRGGNPWYFGSPLVAERSGRDKGSVLVGAFAVIGPRGARRYAFRIYRLRDLNADGNALDPGETTLVYRSSSRSATFDEGSVELGGHRVSRLVMADLTGTDRLSIVSLGGRAVDIARALPGSSAGRPLVGPNGDIYVGRDLVPATNPNLFVLFRLRPTTAGAGAVSTAVRPPAVRTPRARHPLLIVENGAAYDGSPKSFWLDPISGRRWRLPAHVSSACATPERTGVAFTSDATVPREPWAYLSEGGRVTTLSTRQLVPVCPFSSASVLLASAYDMPEGVEWHLVVHELRNGRNQEIVGSTTRFAVSPDGHRVAYVQVDRRGQESLELVDLQTLQRRRLATPNRRVSLAVMPEPSDFSHDPNSTRGRAAGLVFSHDGRSLAYVTGPRVTEPPVSWDTRPWHRRRYLVWRQDVDDGTRRLLGVVRGGPPRLSWSASDRYVLACSLDRGPRIGCTDNPGTSSLELLRPTTVTVFDATGEKPQHVLARGVIPFAAWAPDRDTLAYDDFDHGELHLVSMATGSARRIGGWRLVTQSWTGWSPDGRYIAFENGSNIIDLRTGKVLQRSSLPEVTTSPAAWWPRRGS